MNVTARAEYASLAMLELAANYGSGQPTRIRSIADLHSIPSRFLVQILLQLKNAGLVRSTRGSAGGYRLARDPAQITLADILGAIDSLPGEPPAARPARSAAQVLADTWRRVAAAQRQQLEAITLAELEQQVRRQTSDMYYI